MGLNPKRELKSWAHLRNINVKIDKTIVLSDINLKLNYGDNILILGPNGSGKSTFLKLINRSIYPIISSNSSFTLFDKENINIWDLRKKIGFLFKEMEDRVKIGVKVKELIISGFSGTFNSRYSQLLSKDDIEKVDRLLIELNLVDIINEEFCSLSDGQKRRAMLARALIFDPKILVLDEPFCNLDIKSNYILNNFLHKLIDKSTNIIYVTHSLETILPKTNRVILIKDGKIVDDGKPEYIINSKILSNLFNISIRVIKQDNYWRAVSSKN